MGRRRLPPSSAQRAFRRLKREKDWTASEKKRLIAAMQKYGVNKLELLLPAVPRRSLGELRNFIALRKNEGLWRLRDPNCDVPLEQWLVALRAKDGLGGLNPNSRVLYQVFRLIAETEQHPPPEKCCGIDFREVYNFMSQLTNGTHPTQVSRGTARLLYHSCLWLASTIDDMDRSKYSDFLDCVSTAAPNPAKKIMRTYSRKEKVEPPVFGGKRLNPLSVPENLLLLPSAYLDLWDRGDKASDSETEDDDEEWEWETSSDSD